MHDTTDAAAAGHVTLPAAARSRVRGIDVARGIAIVGMVMIHIGPQTVPGGGALGAAYRSAHGRASILFIVLAGIGVSLLAGGRHGATPGAVGARLWWRALVLLPLGLALQSLPVNVAVILQYYAVYFVVASLLVRLGDRVLLAVAATGLTAGPVIVLWLQRTVPGWFEPGVPAWNDASRIVRDILLTGYYPVAVWIAPLATGMWLGRRDLRAPATPWRMLAGGAIVAAVGFVSSDLLVGALGPATSDGDWRQLAVVVPHNEMPLWVVTASGIAVAITGSCILVARRLPRLVWPMVAFGQLALTVYVLHILVLAWRPEWLVRDGFAAAWASIGRFTLISVALATAYRLVAARGPLEILLRAPWQGGGPRPASRPVPPGARGA